MVITLSLNLSFLSSISGPNQTSGQLIQLCNSETKSQTQSKAKLLIGKKYGARAQFPEFNLPKNLIYIKKNSKYKFNLYKFKLNLYFLNPPIRKSKFYYFILIFSKKKKNSFLPNQYSTK